MAMNKNRPLPKRNSFHGRTGAAPISPRSPLSSISHEGPLSPSLSSSLPLALSETILHSDLAQVVQKLEKENQILKDALRRSEEGRIKTEMRCRQLELKCSQMQSALSIQEDTMKRELSREFDLDKIMIKRDRSLSKGSQEFNKPAEETSSSKSLKVPRSLLSIKIAESQAKPPNQLEEQFSTDSDSRDEPTNERVADELGTSEGGLFFRLDGGSSAGKRVLKESLRSFSADQGRQAEGEGEGEEEGEGEGEGGGAERIERFEDLVLLLGPGGEELFNQIEEDAERVQQPSSFLAEAQFTSPEHQQLAKKYVIMHRELAKLRESYRNQSLILAECEKKLEEALNDKAEVIQSKVDVLKLQSKYGLTWVPDDCVKECLQCGFVFTFFTRQHHCRLCGRLFCANCTTNQCPITALGYSDPVRVCDHCYLVLLSQKRHEKGVDMIAIEFEQTVDRAIRKYLMWDDQQKNTFLEILLRKSSLVQLCYLYRALSVILETYNIGGTDKKMKNQAINDDWGEEPDSRLPPSDPREINISQPNPFDLRSLWRTASSFVR